MILKLNLDSHFAYTCSYCKSWDKLKEFIIRGYFSLCDPLASGGCAPDPCPSAVTILKLDLELWQNDADFASEASGPQKVQKTVLVEI